MAGIKCPRCEYTNPEGQVACVRCATPLPRVKTVGDSPIGTPGGRGPQAPDRVLLRPGEVVAGRYTVLAMIGRGGMGCIYRVRDNALKEEVALKTLLPQLVRDKMVVERFFNEARIARGLSHANIVRVHDIGMTRSEDGSIIYISMELLKGQSLRNMLEALPAGERMPVKTALRILDELCVALEYAHRHTVHRDIKPENVMICEDGTVKLMDFGISKLMDTTRLTQTSMVMGTPFYMSPEQLKNSANVDARADIYSLGVMLYEILTGNVPTGIPKPVSHLTREVPPLLDPIISKCVEADPKDRYQSVAELRKALKKIRDLIETGRGAAPSGSEKTHFFSQLTSNVRPLLGGALLVLLLCLTGAGLFALEQRRAQMAPARHAPDAVATVGLSSDAPGAPIENRINRIKGAITKIKADLDDKQTEAGDKLLKAAEDLLAKAEAAGETENAATLARSALEYCEAVYYARPDMAFIPPGKIALSDGPVTSEAPAVNETVLPGFLIDIDEVTNEQYNDFCAATKWPVRNGQVGAPPESPVTNVTFYDAQAYAGWAKKKLPTEAQWDRAAYGRDAADRMSGDRMSGDHATTDAGVTALGCHDMPGNVAEWTRSISRPLPYDPNDGREDESSITFGTLLVVRGGSNGDESHRQSLPFESASPTVGFRCVKELPSLEDLERGP